MKKRMYELAKTRRGLKKKKAHKRSVYGLSGVPGATRTPGLPLRRRSLCPTELREHGLWGVALGECTSSALGGERSILLSYGDIFNFPTTYRFRLGGKAPLCWHECGQV